MGADAEPVVSVASRTFAEGFRALPERGEPATMVAGVTFEPTKKFRVPSEVPVGPEEEDAD